MRSAVLVLLAGGVFAWFVATRDGAARRALDAEEAALRRLDALRGAGPGEERAEGGYRFHWVSGDDLPPVAVARPEGAGRRWFAAGADGPLYAFDTVLRRAPGGEPDLTVLRRHLARPAAERPADPPGGWDPAHP